MEYSCPKCGSRIEEYEIHTCGAPSTFAPGIVSLLKSIAGGKHTVINTNNSAPQNTDNKKAKAREKRG